MDTTHGFVDIDECTTNTSGCEQGCDNTHGSFACYCLGGYTLDSNNMTCSGLIHHTILPVIPLFIPYKPAHIWLTWTDNSTFGRILSAFGCLSPYNNATNCLSPFMIEL